MINNQSQPERPNSPEFRVCDTFKCLWHIGLLVLLSETYCISYGTSFPYNEKED